MPKQKLTYNGLEKLKKLYPQMPNYELANMFNISVSGLEKIAHRFGLKKLKVPWRNKPTVWTEEKIKLLKELYPTTSSREIAKRLGVSRSAVLIEASRLKLQKDPRYNKKYGKIIIVRKMSETERAWLACAIDGEGSVTYGRKKGKNPISVKISVRNTNGEFIERCKEITNYGSVRYDGRTNSNNRKPIYSWESCSNYANKQILEQIIPYLIIKKDIAELILKYLTLRDAHKSKVPITELEKDLINKITSFKKH